MEEFHEPHVGLGRIYTRTGDQGETSLVGGQRIPKDDLRIAAYGDVDELNAVVGVVLEEARATCPELVPVLTRVQHQLFNLGSQLATLSADLGEGQPIVTPAHIAALEQDMDARNAGLEPLRSFVLPGGSKLNALLHLARTVCRRAERRTVTLLRSGDCGPVEVQYLNRLSDAFFVWSRWTAQHLGHAENLWDPNQG